MGYTSQTDHSLLLFRVAGVGCSVSALEVDSIILPPAHITATPGANKTTPGIFHHATGTVAVVDLRKKFAGPDAVPSTTPGRILLAHLGQSLYGFYVDQVIGIVQPVQVKAVALPANLPHNIFTSALFYQDEIILCSDFSRLHAMPQSGALLDYHASRARVETSAPESTTKAPPVTDKITTAETTGPPSESLHTEEKRRPSKSGSAPIPNKTADMSNFADHTLSTSPQKPTSLHRLNTTTMQNSGSHNKTAQDSRAPGSGTHNIKAPARGMQERPDKETPPLATSSALASRTTSTPIKRSTADRSRDKSSSTNSLTQHPQRQQDQTRHRSALDKSTRDKPQLDKFARSDQALPPDLAVQSHGSQNRPVKKSSDPASSIHIEQTSSKAYDKNIFQDTSVVGEPTVDKSVVGRPTVDKASATSIPTNADTSKSSSPYFFVLSILLVVGAVAWLNWPTDKQPLKTDSSHTAYKQLNKSKKQVIPADKPGETYRSKADEPRVAPEQYSRTQQSEAQQSEAQQSEAQQSEAQQSEAQQSEAQQSEAQQSEAQQSEAQQSEAQQSEAQQSEVQQSEEQLSGIQHPEAQQSEGQQRETTLAAVGPESSPVAVGDMYVERKEDGVSLIIETSAKEFADLPEPVEGLMLSTQGDGRLGGHNNDVEGKQADDTLVSGEHKSGPHIGSGSSMSPDKARREETTPRARSRIFIHIVKRGDTLWDIAKHYINDPWRYHDLVKQNNIDNPDLIYPGEKVKIIFRENKGASE